MKVLMIDNYDSFTYNLVQYLGELGAEVDVVRNDQASAGPLPRSLPASQPWHRNWLQGSTWPLPQPWWWLQSLHLGS